MATTEPRPARTRHGTMGWRYVGRDDGGRELEVIAVDKVSETGGEPFVLVIHAMPTSGGKNQRSRGGG